jgi:hypothetical protein
MKTISPRESFLGGDGFRFLCFPTGEAAYYFGRVVNSAPPRLIVDVQNGKELSHFAAFEHQLAIPLGLS